MAKESWYSESLARGLLVLRAFGRDAERLRMSEVADRTGLTRAAARRFLLTLADLGYVGQDGNYFYLRPRILDLGYAYLSSVRVDQLVEPVLEDIAEKTRAASYFAVLDNDETLFVAGVPSPLMASVFMGVGGRIPAYAGSLGKVLLAWLTQAELDGFLARSQRVRHTDKTVVEPEALRARLAEVRAQGYAVNYGEFIEGIVGVAIPVRNRGGEVVAAINVNRFSPQPLSREEIEAYVAVLREAVLPIERAFHASQLRLPADRPLG